MCEDTYVSLYNALWMCDMYATVCVSVKCVCVMCLVTEQLLRTCTHFTTMCLVGAEMYVYKQHLQVCLCNYVSTLYLSVCVMSSCVCIIYLVAQQHNIALVQFCSMCVHSYMYVCSYLCGFVNTHGKCTFFVCSQFKYLQVLCGGVCVKVCIMCLYWCIMRYMYECMHCLCVSTV